MRNILMLIGELALFVKMDDKRFKNIAQVLVLIQRVNDLKRLGSRYLHDFSSLPYQGTFKRSLVDSF